MANSAGQSQFPTLCTAPSTAHPQPSPTSALSTPSHGPDAQTLVLMSFHDSHPF